MIISLAISVVLLTATMVAIDTSFKSYATAAELASTQATSRLMTHRLLTLVRTSTAHGPLEPNALENPPVTLTNKVIQSHFLELLAPNGDFVRVEYRAALQELWVVITPAGRNRPVGEHPLLGGVTNAQFFARRRENEKGLWVLERATIDVTVQPGKDATLALESGNNAPIRIIASTMPRKLDE